MVRGVVAVVCNLPGVGPRTGAPEVQGREAAKAKVKREKRSIYNPQCQYICPQGVSLLIGSINLIKHH